jgi:lipopolysaccharide/colanic/teichoic acid biosynthesis glycosyltransferase
MTDLSSLNEVYKKTKYKKNYNGFYQKVVKRILDIVIVLVILPFIALLLIPIVIAVKIEDNGPIFYRSRRIGVDFKEFGMWKIRTMNENAPDWRNEDGSTYNSDKDPRVTKVGHFLRETSIDELPQVINVIKGDMSLIGPRAGDVESKDTYSEDEKDKLLIRPGISGYTQAYYRNVLAVREKRLYDAWYAHNVTFLLDVKIFCRTILIVLKRENLYTNVENNLIRKAKKTSD